jgi:hypothetical protein
MKRHITRRHFLKGAVAALYIIPSAALGLDGVVAPSKRVAMGFIGLGGKGVASPVDNL